ncbi:hypothetical protein, partial [Luteimonas salinilitoris]
LILSNWKFQLEQKHAVLDMNWDTKLHAARPQTFDAKNFPRSSNIDPKKLKRLSRTADEDGARIGTYASALVSTLEFPAPVSRGDLLSMSRDVCTSKGARHDLELFVFAPYQPKQKHKPFALQIEVAGRRIKRWPMTLQKDNIRRVLLKNAFPESGCHELRISLHSHITRSSESWRKRSHVEIWLPRLIGR